MAGFQSQTLGPSPRASQYVPESIPGNEGNCIFFNRSSFGNGSFVFLKIQFVSLERSFGIVCNNFAQAIKVKDVVGDSSPVFDVVFLH